MTDLLTTSALVTALVRTELLKLSTTTAPWLAWLAMPALAASGALRAVVGAGRRGAPSVGTSGAVEAALGGFGRGAVLALVLGAMLAVTEHRHGTLAGSLLRTPRRSRLAVAKACAAVAVASLAGLAALAMTVSVAAAGGVLAEPPVTRWLVVRCLGLLLAYPVFALLGLAAGMLLGRLPALALLLPAAWVLILEDLVLGSLIRQVPSWTLTRLADAAAHAPDVHPLLPAGSAAVLLAGWALASVAAATWWLARADVT
jgi:hypothetical protein